MTTVRPATKDDFQAWSKMRFALWPSASAQDHFKELQEAFGKDSFAAWIAMEGSKYIGFAEASVRPYVNGCDTQPVAFLEGIWVDESERKSGIGHKFIEAVEQWAKSKGIREVGSDAEIHNTLSHLCHQKWGFEETERVIYYRKKV